jgi:uncharacterized protein YndB with AHSA1/START domain
MLTAGNRTTLLSMARTDAEVVINRPLEEVFAYISDPSRWAEWFSGLVEAHASETPIRKGTELTSVTKLMGKRIETRLEITEYEPNKRVASQMTSPFQIDYLYTFEMTNGGTRVRVVGERQPRGFFKLVDPILSSMYQSRAQRDLETAKRMLEGVAKQG